MDNKNKDTNIENINHDHNHEKDPIVIVGSARTPLGAFQGILTGFSAPQLGALAIKAAVDRAQIIAQDIDEIIMGCVLPAGQGQAPARQASLASGIPESVGCTTLNKVCGSGMKAVMLAYDSLLAGSNKIVVAGGMESMTQTPYLLDKARSGYRLGHGILRDHMYTDGLEDAYDKGKLMGIFGEATAEKFGLSRADQDKYAVTSLLRAKQATEAGWFNSELEITPISIDTPLQFSVHNSSKKSDNELTTIMQDEIPRKVKPERIPTLKPTFKDNGTITAANSSSIADGAAALVLMQKSEAQKRHLPILATIVGHATYTNAPAWFTTAPVGAIQKLLKKVHWQAEEVDLYEINEAFAVVAMVAMQELKLSHDKVNIHGGACALGHPIGASGARIITTLLGALQRLNKKRGIAAICIGGGEATAIAIER